ncbi:MAG: xanthine phosphoribosyltransferase [Clostridia bacterium]|nr:xanthine phosphoribosyltransferase [Clostridia bacterium]
MNELQKRILAEGRVLPGDIIKVDGFMNHLVDIGLMRSIARDIKNHFAGKTITKVMTVEASGIPVATITVDELGVPMLFAKKAKSDNIEGGLIRSEIYSYTYRKKVSLIVSAEWLSPDDKVLIVDDFMANGEAMRGLVDIIDQVGAELVGIGVAIEKGFQGGGDRLRAHGIDVYSLAIIEKAMPGCIVFRSENRTPCT